MSTLTKQQKMDMVSKAIDAGFSVDLHAYFVETIEKVNEKLSIFPDLQVEFDGTKESQHAWASVNRDKAYKDGFEATIHFK